MADQARFVLAQQAYHDARPQDVAVQLHALSGRWRPDHPLPQTIVGVLADYARAHGFNVGQVAPQIADGRPHQAFRWGVTAWAIRLGTLLVVVGLALDLTGLFRQRAATRLGAAARGTPEPRLVAARASP
jgi:hypothetical protein